MHIYFPKLKQTLSSYGKDLRFFLLYGPDESRIQIAKQGIIEQYAKQYNDLEKKHIPYDQLKASPDLLEESLLGLSLFGGITITIVEECASNINQPILRFLKKDYSGDNIVIFTANEAKKSSAIYKLFAKQNNSLTVGCYKANEREFTQTIRQLLTEYRLEYEPDVIAMLCRSLPNDPVIMRKEIEKLTFYKPDACITVNDLIALIPEAKELTLDSLIHALISGDTSKVMKQLEVIKQENTNYMLILKVLQRFIDKALDATLSMENGNNAKQAVEHLSPPLFFKQKDNMIYLLQKLSRTHIIKLRNYIIRLEITCKAGAVAAELELAQGLFKIARLTKKQ